MNYSGQTVEVKLTVDDTQTKPNSDAKYHFTFPDYRSLVCPYTKLSLAANLEPIEIEIPEGSSSYSQERFSLPEIVDSVSRDKFFDASGVLGCGERVYTVVWPADLIQVDSAAK